MGLNSLPKAVTRQCRGSDSNPGLTAPESSTLSTRLPSHLVAAVYGLKELTQLPCYCLLTDLFAGVSVAGCIHRQQCDGESQLI